MSRLKADLILFFVALVWGFAFFFQKKGVVVMGACTFVALRFLISSLVVWPKAMNEFKKLPPVPQKLKFELIFLSFVFVVGVLLQHIGLVTTTVTNAGFLTGLYAIFVALICRYIYKEKVSRFIFPAALLSVVGIGLLSGGGDFSQIHSGDVLVILCALAFGFQVTLIGRIMKVYPAPYSVSLMQYVGAVLVAGVLALMFEHPTLQDVWMSRYDLIYAGALSGGVAYTLQVVAQQYTPASDSAVLLSLESLFAALLGVLVNGDAFTAKIGVGAVFILLAIGFVEFGPKSKLTNQV